MLCDKCINDRSDICPLNSELFYYYNEECLSFIPKSRKFVNKGKYDNYYKRKVDVCGNLVKDVEKSIRENRELNNGNN